MVRSTISQGLIDLISRYGPASARQINHMPFIDKGKMSDCSPLLLSQTKSGALDQSISLGPTDVRKQVYFSSPECTSTPATVSYEHIFLSAMQGQRAATSSFGLYINTGRLPADAHVAWPEAVPLDLDCFIRMDVDLTNALSQRARSFITRGAKSFSKSLESVYSDAFKSAPGRHVSHMHTDTLDTFTNKLEQAAWDKFLLGSNARQDIANPGLQTYLLTSFPELLFEHQQLAADGDIFSRANVLALCPAATIVHDIAALTDDLPTRLSMLRAQRQSSLRPVVGLPLPFLAV
jgi:hypothetical protein